MQKEILKSTNSTHIAKKGKTARCGQKGLEKTGDSINIKNVIEVVNKITCRACVHTLKFNTDCLKEANKIIRDV